MLLEVRDLEAGYAGRAVVHGVSVAVDESEIVAIIGHNGAGKTTTLKAVFGLLKPLAGQVVYNGTAITGHSPLASVKEGITFSPQDKFVFPELTVRENLDMGAYTLGRDARARMRTVYELFPILEERSWQMAGTLSGGERRMLGLGMALLPAPKLMLLDEPSLGLAPILVQALMAKLALIRDEFGTAIILVEQNVRQALRLSDRVYVMKVGRIILEARAEKVLEQGEWWDLF